MSYLDGMHERVLHILMVQIADRIGQEVSHIDWHWEYLFTKESDR